MKRLMLFTLVLAAIIGLIVYAADHSEAPGTPGRLQSPNAIVYSLSHK